MFLNILLVFVLNSEASVQKDISVKAVRSKFSRQAQIYKKAHRECYKIWSRKRQKPVLSSYSVEIVTVEPELKKFTALCVAKRFKNSASSIY